MGLRTFFKATHKNLHALEKTVADYHMEGKFYAMNHETEMYNSQGRLFSSGVLACPAPHTKCNLCGKECKKFFNDENKKVDCACRHMGYPSTELLGITRG